MELNIIRKRSSTELQPVAGKFVKQPTLPQNFAISLIEKEMELERCCDIETIQELVILYQQVIEYYDFMGDLRYLDYQQRLHSIFIRPQILKTIQQAGRLCQSVVTTPRGSPRSSFLNKSFEFPSTEKRKEEAAKQRAKLAIELGKKAQPMSTNVIRLVHGHDNRSKQCATKAMEDVNSQDQSLKNRILNRRRIANNLNQIAHQVNKLDEINEEQELSEPIHS